MTAEIVTEEAENGGVDLLIDFENGQFITINVPPDDSSNLYLYSRYQKVYLCPVNAREIVESIVGALEVQDG